MTAACRRSQPQANSGGVAQTYCVLTLRGAAPGRRRALLKRWRCPAKVIGSGLARRTPASASQVTFPDILLEDGFIVAFDKPSGLAVSRERGDGSGPTLMGLVRGRFGQSAANVHRLDAEASGVVLCARTKPALDFLSGQFQSKTVLKTHYALVALRPPGNGGTACEPARDAAGNLPHEFSVDLPLGEDADRPGRVRVFRKRGGKPSVTEFRVLESFGRFAWVECRPLTGRMHQVRVHLACAGAPVLNDALYGDAGSVLLLSSLKRGYKGREAERPLITRLGLHAGSLKFIHPGIREPVEITAPLPGEFAIALKYLRKFAGRPTGA
jgi:RluA family pseudouridine synthase